MGVKCRTGSRTWLDKLGWHVREGDLASREEDRRQGSWGQLSSSWLFLTEVCVHQGVQSCCARGESPRGWEVNRPWLHPHEFAQPALCLQPPQCPPQFLCELKSMTIQWQIWKLFILVILDSLVLHFFFLLWACFKITSLVPPPCGNLLVQAPDSQQTAQKKMVSDVGSCSLLGCGHRVSCLFLWWRWM